MSKKINVLTKVPCFVERCYISMLVGIYCNSLRLPSTKEEPGLYIMQAAIHFVSAVDQSVTATGYHFRNFFFYKILAALHSDIHLLKYPQIVFNIQD